jgi:RNA 3'-phosphate cyclase
LISIDGSIGEGGGQILRTAISLSAALGIEVEVFNIRAKRPKPGLRPQHFWSISATAQLCEAEVDGLVQNSTRVLFSPGPIREKELNLDLGTAGSITLLLQSVVQAISRSGKEIHINIQGGTDVKWSPTIDYFREIAIPFYKLLGITVDLEIKERGFYPIGGGRVSCVLRPPSRITPVDFSHTGHGPIKISSICSGLPISVAERQARAASDYIGVNGLKVQETDSKRDDARSPGTSICIHSLKDSDSFIGADGLGERGKAAELVGKETADRFLSEYRSKASVDHHLADMIIPLLAIAGGPSRFTTSLISRHFKTNLIVAEKIAGIRSQVKELSPNLFEVRMNP